MNTTRRNFIKMASLAGTGLAGGGLISFSASNDGEVNFISPVDGDMLCEYDGVLKNECLTITVNITAPEKAKIRINGQKADYSNGLFHSAVELKNYENIIELEDEISGKKKSIKVFRLKNFTNKYRLSLDDNIWFLKDISDNAGIYKSIFENSYLGFLKQVHETYGTKIHLNIYYQAEGFNLSRMTDKFRNEWKENSGWLRLSFHALQNDPDMPYINAGYKQVKQDCDMVMEQIRRFAGEELMGPVTTLHWGEATVNGCRALRDSGYTALAGYFNIAEDESPVSYYLEMDKRKHLNRRFIWRDNQEGIIFSRIAMVINSYDLDKIIPGLDNYKKLPHKPGFLDLMIHEQYFYTDYKEYQPDYRQKVMAAVKWADDNGYKPAFLSECIFD